MKTTFRAAAAVAMALAGCATAGKPGEREILGVSEGPALTADDLKRCEQLGRVSGEGVGGWGTTRDQQEYWARRDALKLAEQRGATHVEILSELDDPNRLVVDGIAYRCAP